jgi:hypothetical protein
MWLWLALPGCLLAAQPSAGCPFCEIQGQTLSGAIKQAALVVYGRLGNAEGSDGAPELIIETVIKPHDWLKGRKTISLPGFVIPKQGDRYRFLFFCNVDKGKLDPFRWKEVRADAGMVQYLAAAMKVTDDRPEKRLRFFFDYLDNPDPEISTDAHKEFGNTGYPEYKERACKLPADRLVKWLQDPRTREERIGLYASTLGHCGKPEHAALLRSMLQGQRRPRSGIDGILAGYVLLQPQEGWQYLRGLLGDPATEFPARYAALRAARFFWDYRPDVVPKKDVAEAIAQLLEQGTADLAIDEFRKWHCWEMTDRILALENRPVYAERFVRRAVLRFALSARDSEAARKFVARQREKDPEGVKYAEDQLKMEQALNAPSR